VSHERIEAGETVSFASVAKRRLPWFDTTRLQQAEAAACGMPVADGICDLVITLFEELTKQSAQRRSAPELEPREAPALPKHTPLLGPGDG
jgi:hypothetical protein